MATDHHLVPDWLNVSRETIGKLVALESLVRKWNPAINLVARSTLQDIWSRHILDSAQVFLAKPQEAARWVDLGSGGGFPGIVVEILRQELAPNLQVTLVESDLRKTLFLKEINRSLGLEAVVKCCRIEELADAGFDVLSARALASLPVLCGFAAKLLKPDGVALLQKGVSFQDEIIAAKANWTFSLDVLQSRIDASSVILCLKGLNRV